MVRNRCRALNNAERADKGGRHGLYPNWEVDERARRLRAVIFIGRNSEFAKGVGFGAKVFSHVYSLAVAMILH